MPQCCWVAVDPNVGTAYHAFYSGLHQLRSNHGPLRLIYLVRVSQVDPHQGNIVIVRMVLRFSGDPSPSTTICAHLSYDGIATLHIELILGRVVEPTMIFSLLTVLALSLNPKK